MPKPLYIVDAIRTVVESMRGDSSLTNTMLPNSHVTLQQIPFFMPGHRVEINNRLLEKAKGTLKWERYPLVALRMDIPEEKRDGMIHYSLNIAIITHTKRNYNAEQRIENVFKPVLHPLYDLFLSKLKDSGLFTWSQDQDEPEHTKIDRPFWGSEALTGNEELIFADPLDAVELIDLRISSYNC